ncbi:MAG: Gfo/Idh/MocA family oxidoreductase [Streptosporangiaceae bacterium]
MRVLLVGCGRIGRIHAESLAHHPLVTSVDVIDPAGLPVSPETDYRVRAMATLPTRSSSWEAAVVATPTADHADVVRALLERQVPVLCEKPIAIDPSVTKDLGALAEAAGVVFRSGLQRRFDPAINVIYREVRDGALGDILWVQSATRDPAPPSRDYLACSGGVFVDMHVHDIDIIGWLLGTTEFEVAAMGGANIEPEVSGLGDHGTTTIALRAPAGALATITGSRWSPSGYAVEATVLGRDAELRMYADGSVMLGTRQATSTVHPGSPTLPKSFLDRFATAYAAEIDGFLSEVVGGEGTGADWRDDAAAVSLALAAQRCAAANARRVVGTAMKASPDDAECTPFAGY